MDSDIFYEQKYNKYKLKYLNLKGSQLLKLQRGSGIASAKMIFYGQIRKNYRDICSIFNSDNFLKDNISNFILPLIDEIADKSAEELALVPIFIDIFNFIESNIDKNGIDYVCGIYLSNGLGSPNTLENIGRLKDYVKKFNLLKDNNKNDEGKILNKKVFPSLTALEEYVDSKQHKLIEIEETKQKKLLKKEKEIVIKEEGIDDVIKHLETDKIIIYQPTTVKGSMYYGRNTKWCTSSTENNRFYHYSGRGPLYIVQSKSNSTDKYQIQSESGQYKNSADGDIPLTEIDKHFDDEKLHQWIQQIYLKDLTGYYFNYSLQELKLPLFYDLKKFAASRLYNLPFEDSLSNLTKLESLHVGNMFNQPFGDSLSNLTSLKTLNLGNKFNQPLDNSLLNLTNLQELSLGYDFEVIDKIDSLMELPNLKKIYVNENYCTSNEFNEYVKKFENIEFSCTIKK